MMPSERTEKRRKKSSSGHRHRDRGSGAGVGHHHHAEGVVGVGQPQAYHHSYQHGKHGYHPQPRAVPPSNSGAARLSMLNNMNLQQGSPMSQGSQESPPAQAYFLPSTHSMGFNDLAHAYFQPNSYERAEI